MVIGGIYLMSVTSTTTSYMACNPIDSTPPSWQCPGYFQYLFTRPIVTTTTNPDSAVGMVFGAIGVGLAVGGAVAKKSTD